METKDILKSLRKSNGYSTMQEFCAAADISFSTYQNYESGKRVPTAEILVKLADFYNVSIDYLLGRPDAKAPADPIDKLMTVDEMEKDLLREWLSLDEASRKAFLDVLRKIVADDQKRQAEDSRSKIMTVKEAARSDEPSNAPHTADYPQALLDEMDKNAPRTDINT